MRKRTTKLLTVVVLLALAVPVSAAEGPSWVQAMRQIHAAHKGEKGVLVHMGDSITYSMAYAEVIRVVVNGQAPGAVSTTILGADPPKPGQLPKIETPAAATRGAGLSVAPPGQDWFPNAPPLPKPTGEIVRVQTVAELYAAAAKVRPGGWWPTTSSVGRRNAQ